MYTAKTVKADTPNVENLIKSDKDRIRITQVDCTFDDIIEQMQQMKRESEDKCYVCAMTMLIGLKEEHYNKNGSKN